MNCTSNNCRFVTHTLKSIMWHKLFLTIITKITLLNTQLSSTRTILNNIQRTTKYANHRNHQKTLRTRLYINHSFNRHYPKTENYINIDSDIYSKRGAEWMNLMILMTMN